MSDVVTSASKRLEELRKALPDTTRGMFELCIMVRLLENSIPVLTQWARSDVFVEQLAVWVAMGCPDFSSDDGMLEAFQQGKWVN